MKEKFYNIIMELNCYFCMLAAILTVTNSPIGSFVFVYTSTVGLVDSIKNKVRSGIIINSTFLAMNTYFSILTIIGLF